MSDEEDAEMEDDGVARRRAAIAEALDLVRHGPRIRISPDMEIPLRLLVNDAGQ